MLEVLKKAGLYDSLFKKREILNAYTIDLQTLKDETRKPYTPFAPDSIYFNAGTIAKEELDTALCNQLLDSEKIDSLINESQRYYYTEDKDMQALVVEYKNLPDQYMIYFLPKGA